MEESHIGHKVFGKSTRPTIYYIVGFRMKIKHFSIHIRALQLAGFRIVAFDIDPRVLTASDPQLLSRALNEFMSEVKTDAINHQVVGTYGISLGSFFALNALTLPQVPKVFLNTGGGSIVQAVWEMQVLEPIKKGFEERGYKRADMEQAWNPIDVSQHIDKIAGKQMLANASYADEYIPIKDVLLHAEDWQREGVKAQLVVYKHLKHKWLIIRTLLKIPKTIRFFR